MDNITLERKVRIQMFFMEYYFGVNSVITFFRFLGGPLCFYIGRMLSLNAGDRFGVAYGGVLVAYSIYYTFKPFWWILVRWKYYKTIEFQLEATSDKLIIKEQQSESQTEYSLFENIIQRKKYFVLRIQSGVKIYLPIDKLSEQTIKILAEKKK